MAVIDVLKWNAAPGVFAWKFPSEELGSWSQLIVSESQEAFLLKEGVAIGPFGAGRHTLSTDNYPMLTSIVKIATGRSPFTAEVWFIQKAVKLNLKWGTAGSIPLEDPRYHIMLPVRAFGQYGIRVVDSKAFLTKLVGTLPAFVEKTIGDYFRGVVVTQAKDAIAKYLVNENVSILQISAYLNELSHAVEAKVSEVTGEYGIQLVNFTINSISTDENDPAVVKLRNALATKAEMNIIGYNYQQMRSFDTMESAAKNSNAGGVLGASMGMGIGMGMGVPIGGAIGNAMGDVVRNMQCGSNATQDKESGAAPQTKCVSCGWPVVPGAKFCSNCGACQEKECPQCKTKCQGDARFCPECGNKL